MAKDKKKISITEEKLIEGRKLISQHSLFGKLDGYTYPRGKDFMGKENAAKVDSVGYIYLNKNLLLEPKQWAYVIAHCLLHLAFGHFDADRMPGIEIENPDGSVSHKVNVNKRLWNLACDIYITKFLQDMKFGKSFGSCDFSSIECSLTDERKIYQYLMERGFTGEEQSFGTAAIYSMDMIGLEKPVTYDSKYDEVNEFMETFAKALAHSASEAVSISGGHGKLENRYETKAERAREWFISSYPLLGGIAAAFKLVEDSNICNSEEISIAAIDTERGEIYINPAAKLSYEEMKFVMAHEFLHAGLSHHERCQGRDHYLWNVACDYVINGWLCDMGVGSMPDEGLLYDEAYIGWSAESIYDEILLNLRQNSKLKTFRGYGKGDIIEGNGKRNVNTNGVSLDEFCRSALSQGLEYHKSKKRGFIPAGLVEEIRALSMPPIPWDVKLAKWFDGIFSPVERHHTYARPSRRQGTTPDIPRPRYVKGDLYEEGRTFGVVIDTSGSMSAKTIGMAIGSIASYAASKEVPMARIVFCDARAYDAGYLAPEDIAGRVEVRGRGGTKLQPGIDLLESAKDFPKDGPILVITDGEIECNLAIHRKHAFLIPKGGHLPFKAKGEVFYFGE